MKTKLTILILALTALLLAACGSPAAEAAVPESVIEEAAEVPAEAPAAEEPAAAEVPAVEAKPAAESAAPGFDTGTRLDEQGAVVVEVTPANLNSGAETLDFGVALNTHSVDLGMDFATLSTLTTDTGLTVDASAWSGASGGHHVSGTLSFPATVDGAALLGGATEITLTIRDVDAPERVFVWKLTQS